jgi:septation ring formation regulator EzrA
MKIFSTLLVSLLVISACTDVQKPRQLKTIKALNHSLDSIKTVITANRLDSAHHYSQISQGVELRIKNHYFADTINLALGQKMDAYKVMRRKFNPLGMDYTNILKGAEEIKESLRELKHDIENGDGNRDKYDEYILFEKGKFEQINALCKDYVSTRNETMATFNQLHNELNAFSFELVKKAEAKKK